MFNEQKSEFLCCLESLQCAVSPPSEHFLEYEGTVHRESATLPIQKENILIPHCKSVTAISSIGEEKDTKESAGLVQQTLMHATILGITN